MNDLVSMNIAAWLACLAFLIVLINGGLKLIDRLKGNPPSSDLDKSIGSLTQRIAELEKIALDGVERRRLIHERISGVEKATTERCEDVRRDFDGKLNRVHERIDQLPGKIVELLKNTGVIK